jgi:LAO/AO transport system kinase
MKMGMLEIADVFVVNKGDKPEAEELKLQLEIAVNDNRDTVCRALRQLGKSFAATYAGPVWTPPVVLLSALRQTNGEALIDACRKHLDFLKQPELATALKRNRLLHEIIWRAGTRFQDRLVSHFAPGGKFAAVLDACVNGSQSLDQAVSTVLGSN